MTDLDQEKTAEKDGGVRVGRRLFQAPSGKWHDESDPIKRYSRPDAFVLTQCGLIEIKPSWPSSPVTDVPATARCQICVRYKTLTAPPEVDRD